jgi:hypothetical protein
VLLDPCATRVAGGEGKTTIGQVQVNYGSVTGQLPSVAGQVTNGCSNVEAVRPLTTGQLQASGQLPVSIELC